MQHFLIKFQVQGLNGSPVIGAKLKLYNTNDSTIGGQFYQVTNQTWTEESVTWNNAPATEQTLIASLGAVEPGNWYEVDVTSIITGDGTYSLRVSSTSGNGADYSSKEGAHAPVLEVTTGSGATATPSPTATFTITPTPSATPATPNGNAEYFYDGDGNLVKSIIGDITTYYPSSNYEKRVDGANETVMKYYFAGSVRIAMRENGAITWLLSDHLGSTSITADGAGNLLTSLKYTAYGELRSGNSQTDYQYTGQRNEIEIGLYYYVARFYDPQLARFISADTIVPEPGSVKAYDRFAYVNGNPVNYNDPTGHGVDCGIGQGCISSNPRKLLPKNLSITYHAENAVSTFIEISTSGNYNQYPGTNCTTTISNAANIGGGIPQSKVWNDSKDSLAWNRPQENFEYWTRYLRFNFIESDDLPPKYDPLDKDKREHIIVNQALHDLIRQYINNIKPGDYVYYMDPREYSRNGSAVYTHMAMVVDIVDGIPYVHDVDGPTNGYTGESLALPRSIYDTDNDRIQKISIVFMGR